MLALGRLSAVSFLRQYFDPYSPQDDTCSSSSKSPESKPSAVCCQTPLSVPDLLRAIAFHA